jgi:hypothetical protein
MGTIDSNIVVERILSLFDEGIKDNEIIIDTICAEFYISNDDAGSLLELTQAGLLRANFIFSGQQYPKSNLNNNPIVRSAMKIGLSKLGRADLYETVIKQNRPWWKFW